MTAPRQLPSLTLRLAGATALFVAVSLVLTGVFVARLTGQWIEAAADAPLEATLDAIIAAVETDVNGRPVLDRTPSNPAFERPLSGWYWRVSGPGGTLSSRSVWDGSLPPDAGGDGLVARDVTGPRGEALRLLERRVEVVSAAAPLLVQVGAARAGTDAELGRVRRRVGLAFAVLGVALTGGVALLLLWGLRPLGTLRDALAAVRAGERERLGVAAPSEVAPLVEEIDALLAANRETVRRAREHVGNLAHALKTPVAVLGNALRELPPDVGLALGEAAAVERIVRHHLGRARAGGAQAGGAAVALRAVTEEVAAALRRLHGDRPIQLLIEGDSGLAVRIDRQDLAEVLGNLMENACAWARGVVRVEIAADGGGVRLRIEDDGPGLATGDGNAACERRWDERNDGSGLGLGIVTDLVALHGGGVAFGRSRTLGGLSVVVELPWGGSRKPEPNR